MAGQQSLPSRPGDNPGLPENFHQWTLEEFTTLNTKPLRPGIKDDECYIMDGLIPLGPSNLRALWGTGDPIYTVANGLSVVWYAFGNIADQAYAVILRSDGAMDAVLLPSFAVVPVMPAGTILNPSTVMGFSQWGSLYLVFAKDQENGYWVWDGQGLFTAGTIGPDISITNSGKNYTSPPGIQVITTGAGTGVTFNTQIDNGHVTSIKVVNPGSGFAIDDFSMLLFSGGGSDTQALATPAVFFTEFAVKEVIVNNPGSGYTGRTSVQFIGAPFSVSATASVIIQNGSITAISLITTGYGYTLTPFALVTDPGGGAGFSGTVVMSSGQIGFITVTNPGSGYTSPPTVKIIGDGTGATAVAEIDATGIVTFIAMLTFGSGYTKALVELQGGNDAANATPIQMPFGISGTSVEVYQSRVWVTNGGAISDVPTKNRTLFTAAESVEDFGNGGGAFQSFDSFLRVGYHWMRQTNGFLYLGGDSSLNYISAPPTTNTPGSASVSPQAITTFPNQNVDPQIGSSWPSSVQVFSRNIVFANTIGVFVSYGGAVTKVSEPLDGFYGTGPIFGPTADFSSAVADIFSIPVYMLLLPVIDQSGNTVNKLLMWTGKRWFTASQDRNLTYIATQEFNSVLTAYGTDGVRVFPLFQRPTTALTKTVQSKLFSNPSYYAQKTALRLHAMVNSYTLDSPINVTIDTEVALGTGNASVGFTPAARGLNWVNNLGQPIVWNLQWGTAGLAVIGPIPVAQQGRLIGITATTTASDFALLSFIVTGQSYTINN